LKIHTLRRGADANPSSAFAANTDESKANPYPNLPDPLTLTSGQPVTSSKIWWSHRRPEIVEAFDREIYGRVPGSVPAVRWEVSAQTQDVIGGVPTIIKQLLGRVDNSSYPLMDVTIRMTLTMPADARGPVPVIMEF